ncbi:MAG: hypothetical protein LBE80_07965 [Deltaproteobacteria bacterium]|jgi:hypothetical protein|nr:hypothetical protein [Deltaproteobacteria bacterium]
MVYWFDQFGQLGLKCPQKRPLKAPRTAQDGQGAVEAVKGTAKTAQAVMALRRGYLPSQKKKRAS